MKDCEFFLAYQTDEVMNTGRILDGVKIMESDPFDAIGRQDIGATTAIQ